MGITHHAHATQMAGLSSSQSHSLAAYGSDLSASAEAHVHVHVHVRMQYIMGSSTAHFSPEKIGVVALCFLVSVTEFTVTSTC